MRQSRPDDRMSAASNFHIRLSRVRTEEDGRPVGWSSTRNFHICGMDVWTMIGRHPDSWSWIHNFHISCMRVRTMADWRSNCWIWIAIPALRRSASGQESTSSGRLHQTSHSWTWKESEAWSNTERHPRAAETSGRMQTGTKASRYSGGSRQKSTSSGRMMLGLSGVQTVWHVVRTDGTVDKCASGWDGTVVRTADREPEIFWLAEFSKTLQNSGIPC
jgi:hypothetical protein